MQLTRLFFITKSFFFFTFTFALPRNCSDETPPDLVRAEIQRPDGNSQQVPEESDRKHGPEREDPDVQLQPEYDHGSQDQHVQDRAKHPGLLSGMA